MDVVTLFKMFIDLILGFLGVPFIEFIKAQFGWSQGKALLLAVVVAGVLGAAELAIAGYFDLAKFTLDQLFYTISAVVAVSQIYYKKLQYSKDKFPEG